MTASERMAGLVEDCQNAAHLCAVHGADDPHDCEDAAAALLAAIGELERDRDAQASAIGADHDYQHMKDVLRDTLQRLAASQAEVARLAGVAMRACDVIERTDAMPMWFADQAKRLRAAIPTPDPADDGDCTACGGPSCACVDDATPDPAAFVAAVDAYGREVIESCIDNDGQPTVAVNATRAALRALGGVR